MFSVKRLLVGDSRSIEEFFERNRDVYRGLYPKKGDDELIRLAMNDWEELAPLTSVPKKRLVHSAPITGSLFDTETISRYGSQLRNLDRLIKSDGASILGSLLDLSRGHLAFLRDLRMDMNDVIETMESDASLKGAVGDHPLPELRLSRREAAKLFSVSADSLDGDCFIFAEKVSSLAHRLDQQVFALHDLLIEFTRSSPDNKIVRARVKRLNRQMDEMEPMLRFLSLFPSVTEAAEKELENHKYLQGRQDPWRN